MTLLSDRLKTRNQTAMKRSDTLTQDTRPMKVPRAEDIHVEQGPQPAQAPRRLPEHAAVEVCIMKYTDRAADLWERISSSSDDPLYQIQIDHPAQNSMTFKMRESFTAFLRAANKEDPKIPRTLSQLEEQGGIRMVITDAVDIEQIGFIQWRVAFYATDACNFLRLLDGWLRHTTQENARQPAQQVNLRPSTQIDLSSITKELLYNNYTLQPACNDLPLHVFEAQPVKGRKILTLNVQVEDDHVVSLILSGQTWPWRQRLDEFGIRGVYVHQEENCNDNDEDVDDTENVQRRYYRVLKNVAVDDAEQERRVFSLLENVFNNVVMRVQMDDNAATNPNTAVGQFIEKLRQKPNMIFTTPSKRSMETTHAIIDNEEEDTLPMNVEE